MELDKFITQSLKHIIQGMRGFQRSEIKRAEDDRQRIEIDPTLVDEGASVFPELSGKSGELGNSGLLKAAEQEGFEGRSTIMARNISFPLSFDGLTGESIHWAPWTRRSSRRVTDWLRSRRACDIVVMRDADISHITVGAIS